MIPEEDLKLIDEGAKKDKRNRVSFLVKASLEKAEKIMQEND